MKGSETTRLHLLSKDFQNSFCGILYGFVVDNLLRGVYECHLHHSRVVAREEQMFVQTIGLAHTTTHLVAFVGALEELFGR